jgi:iron-sulfur cluster assembly accessory protein
LPISDWSGSRARKIGNRQLAIGNDRRLEIGNKLEGEYFRMSATSAPTVALNVTENAATEIKKFMAGEEDLPETSGLRVRVVPGGCSGFQYSLNIEEDSRQGDFILNEHGVRLFVDMFSAQYLNGVEIDFVSGVMGSGFTFKNPNATGSCGCGSSFTA